MRKHEPSNGQSLSAELLEDRRMLAADLVISEFMAKNGLTLLDGDGVASDWIEISNLGDETADVRGWYLTDDSDALTKWTFPSGTIGPGERLVVFASGKSTSDYVDGNGSLHTNFKLSGSGEYLALVQPDQTVADEFAPSYPRQFDDVSFGRDNEAGDETIGYFVQPTPGTTNDRAVQGFVADTTFSHHRGFYDEPFDVEILTATENATIRYTTDGSMPSNKHGEVYSAPVRIDGTTILRAAAFREGYLSSNTDTQTYVFLEQVIRQPNEIDRFPDNWGRYNIGPTGSRVPADYEMNQSIVEDHIDTIIDDLKALPTMSIVMDQEDLFGSQAGIYSHPFIDEEIRERPTSVEWIEPNGGREFQLDAAIRLFGGWSRHFWATPKKSFALKFKRPFGPTKLDFPLFESGQVDSKIDPVEQFDTVLLRAVFSDAWPDAASPPQYLRDLNARYTQLAMGQLSSHGTWVHLYLNGVYWGIYNPSERPEASFMAAYLGGEREEYDAVKHRGLCGPGCASNDSFEVVDGGDAASDGFRAALSAARKDLRDPDNYAAFTELVDVENLADYILLEHYIGNVDWPHKNWYAARKRDGGDGWKFFAWDSEYTLRSPSDNRLGVNNANTPAFLYARAKRSPEFQLLFADRVQKHMFNDGVLQPDANAERYSALAAQIEGAIRAELARWGDNGATRKGRTNFRYSNWTRNRDTILRNFFPRRHDIALRQIRSEGLYPDFDAATFSRFGGAVERDFPLEITAESGTIYFTTDGSDPRAADNSPVGQRYVQPLTLSSSVQVKARVLLNGDWSALTDATFLVDDPPSLAVSELMFNPAIPDTEFIELTNVGDTSVSLAGIQFTDGINVSFTGGEILPGEHVLVVADEQAMRNHYGDELVIAGQFVDSSLDNGGESIRLEDPFGRVIFDFDFNDRWFPIADGLGFSLVSIGADSDASQKSSWRPSQNQFGSPGAQNPDSTFSPASIVVNELVANSSAVGGDFVELHNTTDHAIDIGNWYLSDDGMSPQKFRIVSPFVIPGRGYALLTERSHFGAAANPETGFSLDSFGGEVSLVAANEDGNLIGYQQVQRFDVNFVDIPIGRIVNSTGRVDFVPMSTSTRAAANADPLVWPVVISEVMFDPIDGGDEYIELTNHSRVPSRLYEVANPRNRMRIEGAVEFEFPENVVLAPNEITLVVPIDPESFRTKHNVPDTVRIFGPYSGALNNGGESIRLEMPSHPRFDDTFAEILVDRVRYEPNLPWPSGTNGLGASIERVTLNAYGDDPTNWKRSSFAGSPGRPNIGIDATPPTAPTNLRLIGVDRNSAEIHWNAANDPESTVVDYAIYRDEVLIATTQSNSTSFRIDDINDAGTFVISVAAINGDGVEGRKSSSATLTQLDDAASDTYISEAASSVNFGDFGALVVSNDNPQGTGQSSVGLLEWDLSGIPVGASVDSAAVTFNVSQPSDGSFELYAVRRDWAEETATWNQATTNSPWQANGANGKLDRGLPARSTVFLDDTSDAKRFVPSEPVREWTSLEFDDAMWRAGKAAVGYEEASSPLIDGLAAAWRFDETGTPTTATEIVSGRADIITGQAQSVSGQHNQALRFDGTTHIDLSAVNGIRDGFTIAGWIKPDARNRTILSNVNTGRPNRGFWFGYNQDGPWLGIAAGASSAPNSTGSWVNVTAENTMSELGRWYHVAVTFDATNTSAEVQFFVNGTRLDEGVEGANIADGLMGDSADTPMRIGIHNADVFPFEGDIDELALFDRPLEASQIQQLFEQPGPVLGGKAITPLIRENIAAELQGKNGVYLRIPFSLDSPQDINHLALNSHYADGFIAYLNGTEIARRNVPEALAWNSTAVDKRSTLSVLMAESLDVSAHLDQLLVGKNVLAIHGLDHAANDGTFLIDVELVGTTEADSLLGVLESPTRGNNTVQLNQSGVDLIQQWVDSADQNFGIALVPIEGEQHSEIVVASSESPNAISRPQISIGYSSPDIFGDVTGDGVVDVADVDAVCTAARFNDDNRKYDLNGDGITDSADQLFLVQSVFNTNVGDANLDGIFNSTDFVVIFRAGEYEDELFGNSTWMEGDWNCDGEFGTTDLVEAFRNGKYVRASRPLSFSNRVDSFFADIAAAMQDDDRNRVA